MNKGNFSGKRETEYPGQLHFHYNREERYKTLSPEVREKLEEKRRFFNFKKNRGLMILFLDILLILLLYFVVVPIINKYARKTELFGYEMQMRAFLFEDNTFVSLKIEYGKKLKQEASKGTGPAADAGDQLVTVRFALENSDIVQEIVDVLPESPEEVRIIRTTLPAGRKKQKVLAEVLIGEELRSLKTEIIPEQD